MSRQTPKQTPERTSKQSTNQTQTQTPKQTKKSKKRELSREILKSHRIHFDENYVYDPENPQSEQLPEHVDAVRQALLSFECSVVGGRWKQHFENEATKYAPEKVASNPQENLASDAHEEAVSEVLMPKEARLPEDSFQVPLKGWETDNEKDNPEWNAVKVSLQKCGKVAEHARTLDASPEDRWTYFWRDIAFKYVSETRQNHTGFQ